MINSMIDRRLHQMYDDLMDYERTGEGSRPDILRGMSELDLGEDWMDE